MKRLSVLLVSILLLLVISTGCGPDEPIVPPATEPSESTPEDTAAPTPTPKPFNLEQLSGFLIYSSRWRYGSIQHIGIASPDWSTREIIIPHPNGTADYPVWSPDGHYIVYTYFETEQGLYNEIRLFEVASNTDSSLTPQHIDGTVKCLSWSSDENYVAFDLLQNGTNDRELYLVNIKTKKVNNLTNSDETLDQDPAWSPASNMIAFASDRGGSFDIWTIEPGSTDPWSIPPGGGTLHNLSGRGADPYRDIRPSWSPDGSLIAFYRFDSTSAGLWLMNADGSEQRLLLGLGTADYVETPVWSPNGEWIALIAGGNPVQNVWLVNPTTGETRQASADPGRYGYLSWAPDSSAIVYEDEVRMARGTVVRLHALDGGDDYSWELESIIYFLQWSPVDKLPGQDPEFLTAFD